MPIGPDMAQAIGSDVVMVPGVQVFVRTNDKPPVKLSFHTFISKLPWQVPTYTPIHRHAPPRILTRGITSPWPMRLRGMVADGR